MKIFRATTIGAFVGFAGALLFLYASFWHPMPYLRMGVLLSCAISIMCVGVVLMWSSVFRMKVLAGRNSES